MPPNTQTVIAAMMRTGKNEVCTCIRRRYEMLTSDKESFGPAVTPEMQPAHSNPSNTQALCEKCPQGDLGNRPICNNQSHCPISHVSAILCHAERYAVTSSSTTSAKDLKNLPANFLAVLWMSRLPSCASLPPMAAFAS